MLKTFFDYINNYKLSSIFAILSINIFSELYKLVTYKNINDFISNLLILKRIDNIIVSFFIELSIIHLIQNFLKYILEKIISLGIRNLFKNIITKIINYPVDFFKKDTHDKIIKKVEDLNNMEIMLNNLLIELPKIVTVIGYYMYIIYNFYPTMVLFIFPINIFMVIILHLLNQKQNKTHMKKNSLDTEVKNRLLETTTNIEFVKLNNNESHEIDKIYNSYFNYTNSKIKNNWIIFCGDFISKIFNDFLTLIVYSIGVLYIIQGTLTTVELIYLSFLTSNFCMHIIQLKNIYNFYQKLIPIIQNFNDDDELIIHKLSNSMVEELQSINKNNIIFNNVTFSYNGIENVIENLSFEFIGNKINLLLGPNGSGKSTIIKLLLRLYDLPQLPNKNKIYFKGSNIKNISLNELRNRTVFVSQEPYIFNENIIYNIKYGNENLSNDKIIDLCEVISSKEWLLKNKDKMCGFRGKNLSGGERKKVQLINAICKNAEIIIFDEPTNTLDSNAIKWFIDFIKLLRNNYNKTIIIITHDVRLKDISDHIIDLNKLIN